MRTGITFSSFDLLHAGHVQMLREAKEQCDYLICGLNLTPVGKTPVQSIVERYTQLKAVSYVDEIIPYQSEQDLIDILELYLPSVRIIGEDYRYKDFTGKEECRKLGIDVYYNSRQHRFSSSRIRNSLNIKGYDLSEYCDTSLLADS